MATYTMHGTVQFTVLNKLLSTKRPHGSATNKRITEWLRQQLPFALNKSAFFDGAGNLHVDNRSLSTHRTLFVAHVDTVHRGEGKNKINKTKTHWYAKGDVLGADDGAGVALLFHLIHNNVAGYYIFTQGEERGGVGARYLAEKMTDLLYQFDRAIAFDRRGIDSVITHQGWGRCCSDEFGNALADALMLHNDNLMMLNDDTGVYTDTAEFTDIIPECTNISVGYDKEHTQSESLNLVHYQQLSSSVVQVDWDNLPTSRDPSVVENKYDDTGTWGNWWQEYKTYSGGKYAYDMYDYMEEQPASYTKTKYVKPDPRREEAIDAVIDAQHGQQQFLLYMIADSVYPEDATLALKHMNAQMLTYDTLEEAYEALDHGEDIDLVLAMLFDEMHVS